MINMEALILLINNFVKLDADTTSEIKKYFREERFKKNDFVIKEGKICDKFFLLNLVLLEDFV